MDIHPGNRPNENYACDNSQRSTADVLRILDAQSRHRRQEIAAVFLYYVLTIAGVSWSSCILFVVLR